MVSRYLELLEGFLEGLSLSDSFISPIAQIICFLSLFVVAIFLYFFCSWIIRSFLYILFKKTKTQFDDLLVKNYVFTRLCLLIPAYIIRLNIADAIPDYEAVYNIIILLTKIYEIFIYARVIDGIITTLLDYFNSFEKLKNKPLKSISQIFKVIVYAVCFLLVIALLTNKELSNILIGLGTLSAVLMLIFKDSILGFVGSIQLSLNDMLRVGDWIAMPSNRADGTVVEIGLTTVKVQNWDNTITTIPTYSLISSAFTNWRGMSESGGRRLARSIIIDVDTVKFCDNEMLERYKKINIISKYINDKELEIKKYNSEHNIDDTILPNGRRQTNLGVFTAYLKEYLMTNPNINKELTLMVRQLEANEYGIPLQIYAFSKNKEWIAYEGIQGDIFDHIYAVVQIFDLKIYQRPYSEAK